MRDATRQEVMQWCIATNFDFTCEPLVPPPEGWIYARDNLTNMIVITPMFTITDRGDDITKLEVNRYIAKNALHHKGE